MKTEEHVLKANKSDNEVNWVIIFICKLTTLFLFMSFNVRNNQNSTWRFLQLLVISQIYLRHLGKCKVNRVHFLFYVTLTQLRYKTTSTVSCVHAPCSYLNFIHLVFVHSQWHFWQKILYRYNPLHANTQMRCRFAFGFIYWESRRSNLDRTVKRNGGEKN